LALGGSQFGGYSRSTDGGASWSPIPDATAGSAPFISKIANSRTDPDLVFTVGSTGVMRSDDFGASWTLTPIVGSWLGYRPFANVEVSAADPQVVWATSRLTVDPPSGQAGGIYVSDDGGLSFQRITTLPGGLSESSGVGVHPTDPSTAYLLFSEPGKAKVLRTTDLGLTWEDISGFTSPTKIGESASGFPDVAVFSLLVMPFDPDILWAGTEIGIFESSDAGTSWSFADNGMASVAVFQMQVVDDEIVVATQGRGVWSVAMPELVGYTPPVVTLSPRVLDMAFAPSGHVSIQVDLRSPYDSAELTLNGTSVRQYAANDAPVMDVVLFPVTIDATFTARVTASRNGREYRSSTRTVQAFAVTARNQYTTDFEDGGVSFEFVGNAYSFGQPSGFTDRVMQTAHPYANAGDAIMMLKVPIRVDELQPLFKYSDVCLVEEGVVNDYTDPNFFDYVIVEGTRDGANWLPLLNGYDSRADPAWLSRYRSGLNSSGNSNASGNETLIRDHTINLQDFFAPGELIFVRFRLHADPLAWAWGWAIDDISIQDGALSLGDPGEIPNAQLPRLTRLHQNYPNPLNPRTTISYELSRDTDVRLVVYSLAGRRVRTLVQADKQPAGQYTVQWDGTDQKGAAVASGVYVYQLEAGGKRQTKKLAVVR